VFPVSIWILILNADGHCFSIDDLVVCALTALRVMTADTSKLRQVLIARGKVITRREQLVGSIRLHKPLGYGVTFPRELEVSWVVISIGSSDSQEQYAGVRMHMQSIGNDVAEQECYLDAEEVQEFIEGMDVVSSFRGNLGQSLSETRDAYYSSKEDARVGIYKSPGESELRPYLSLLASGDVHFFTADNDEPSDDSSSLVPVKGDEFTPLRTLTSSALEDLRLIVGT
jgi:hypothetical protein